MDQAKLFLSSFGGGDPNPSDPGDSIGNSLRFRPQAYLQRDGFSSHPAGHENTYSVWVKLGDMSGGAPNQYIFDRGAASYLRWMNEGWTSYGGGATDSVSTSKYRDPHAWYHLCWQTDNYANSGTMWVNGQVVNDFSAYDFLNDIYGGTLYIGADKNLTTSLNWTGYMSEVIYIDGRKEDVSAFGRYNENGVWVPKKPDFTASLYSDQVVSSSGSWFGPGYDNTAMFDGDLDVYCQTLNEGDTATFTPIGGIEYTSSVRVYSNRNAPDVLSLNGGADIPLGAAGVPGWTEVATGSGTIESMAFSGFYGGSVCAIEVDGEILIDSTMWSNMITDTGFGSGSDVSYFFQDNSLSSTFSAPGPAVFTPTTPLHVNEKVSLWVESSNVAFSVNGGATTTAVSGQYTDIAFTGDLTQVSIEWGVGEASLTRLAIDGNQLIDGKNFSFGPEGFYLDFADPNAIGNDISGNNNHFTDTGFTLDNPDSPNYDLCTDTASQNHAVLSPLWRGSAIDRYGPLSHANLRSGPGDNNADDSVSALEITEKTYLEFITTVAGLDNLYPGLITMDINKPVNGQYEFYGDGSNSAGIANNTDAWNADDVVRIEIDPTVNPPTIGIAVNNGTFTYNDMPAYTQDTKIGIGVKGANGGYAIINYGQKPWRYGPQEGFAGLSTLNMEEPPIFNGKDHFRAITGPGDGVSEVTFPNQLNGNWSSQLSASPGGFRTDYPVEFAFNGVGNSATALQGSAIIEFKPDTPIAYTSQVRVGPNHSVGSPGEYSFNYGPWTAFPGPWPGYNIEDYATNGFTIASGSGDLESIRIRRLENSDQPSCIFIQVDDDILIDGGILPLAQQAFPNGLWWIKDRVNTNQHQLVDSVRGATQAVNLPTSSNGEVAYDPPDGDSVAWCWSVDGAASANTDGSIETQVAVNSRAGFSIITYTGDGGAASTIGHGLGAVPEFYAVWCRTTGQSLLTTARHKDLTNANKVLYLASNSAETDYAVFGGVLPTNSVITVQGNLAANTNGNNLEFVMYAWTSIPGYSAFGSYTSNNNADGPFVYTGFRPSWIMFKGLSAGTDWMILDSTRDTNNPANAQLRASSNIDERANSAYDVDFLSNGFKLRNAYVNSNNTGDYIYAAFAENPFQAPVTAR